MKKNIFGFLALSTLLLASCDYGYFDKTILYENKFSPRPNSSYDSVIDIKKSSFVCTYQSTYNYVLVFNDGNVKEHKGNYYYSNDKMFLCEDNETKIVLVIRNYYQFTETIEYEGVEYNIIWHASHIFD